MAQNSRIEWTHHTFNPWWGCTKVSAGCDFCYAETWAKRTGHKIWGHRSERRFLSDQYWRQPYVWNRIAESDNQRHRVFCASMADVFEWRKELSPLRSRLWDVIVDTPWLDWLLLTKRPHLVSRLVPWKEEWPENVWIGTTVENQHWAEKRIRHLVDLGAQTKFLSCEPLLGLVDLSEWLDSNSIDWVIAGGESGPHARPSDPAWFRSLRNQCRDHSVPFHFKQWGEWAPTPDNDHDLTSKARTSNYSVVLTRLGKKQSGRVLDGRTWDQFPSLRNTQN
jgi:protein gp37